MNLTFPKRYLLSLLAFFGFFNAFVLRSNLSIAIVPMIKSNVHLLSTNTTIGYNWNTQMQGHILSAFFYSYTLVQIPAGFLATKYGGKILFGGSVGFCAFLTLFTPICAYLGSTALIILRVCEGFVSGFIYPSVHALWAKWAPKDDKSKLAAFSFSGSYIGTMVTMMLGGLIATHWSWEWVFYLSGIVALAWTAAWFYLISESPALHPTISKEEASYIESNLTYPISRNYSIPWKDILTSFPVWAIIAAHFGTNCCIYVIFTEFPTFLTQALGYRLDQAGLFASIPWLALAILLYVTGLVSDRLAQNHSIGFVRKLVLSIAFVIIALALLCVTLLSANQRILIIICIIIAIGSCGLAWASFGVNHLDIGAHFAGVLMGLSNCVGSIPGIVAPILTGYIVENPYLKREWNIIFMITIVICIFVLMFYSFFASGDLQDWVTNHNDEYQHVLNNPISSRDISQGTGLNEHNLDDLTDRIKAEIQNDNEANN